MASEQEDKFIVDGRFELKLPVNFNQPEGFMQDVMKYAGHAEIIQPASLVFANFSPRREWIGRTIVLTKLTPLCPIRQVLW